MIFRLSQKLNAKIKAGVLRALPLHENPLADWSAHLFVAGRTLEHCSPLAPKESGSEDLESDPWSRASERRKSPDP
jgi:hypothetical protein